MLVLAEFLLSACAGNMAPVMNIESSGLNLPSNARVTMQQVEKAIYKGAGRHNWVVRSLEPGRLEAKIYVRSHTAVVLITHDTKSFSITYKDSQNLRYDGTRIKHNYNRWVLHLRNDILRETSKLK